MKTGKRMVLVTHSGTFHADDVFAYAVLSSVFPNHELIRSRDKADWAKGDIVFDVGGGEFDHHNVDKIYRDNGVPYASFGLVWKAFGEQYLGQLFSESEKEAVMAQIDKEFVQAVDAFDNGMNLTKENEVELNTLSDIVASFNNVVDAVEVKSTEELEKRQDVYFLEATKMANRLLHNKVVGIKNVYRDKEVVKKAFEDRSDNRLIVLEKGCNWEDTIWELDKEQEVLFVVYPKPDGHYIQVMRKGRDTFEARKDLPASWAGLREDLGEVVGIDDAIFCHPARFLAGAKSKESILKMAEQAIQTTEKVETNNA